MCLIGETLTITRNDFDAEVESLNDHLEKKGVPKNNIDMMMVGIEMLNRRLYGQRVQNEEEPRIELDASEQERLRHFFANIAPTTKLMSPPVSTETIPEAAPAKEVVVECRNCHTTG